MTAFIGRREFISLLGGAAVVAAGGACAAGEKATSHWIPRCEFAAVTERLDRGLSQTSV